MSSNDKKFSDELSKDPTKRAQVIADVKAVLKKHGVSDTALNAEMAHDEEPNGVFVYSSGPLKSTWIVS